MSTETVIVGRRPVLEALKAGTPISTILLLEGAHGQVIEEIRNRASEKHIKVSTANAQTLHQIAGDAVAQGVAALSRGRRAVDLGLLLRIPAERRENGFVLILDGIEDPHNLGALVRTAECAGAHGVVIPKYHAASITGSAVKASAGATEHMAIAEVTNIVQAIQRMKDEGYWVIGLDAAAGKAYTAEEYVTPVAIVVGNEGKGIRRLVKEHCDHLVNIPVHGKISSLNASVAGAIVMYEVARQRHRP